jgi:hypothetical protein
MTARSRSSRTLLGAVAAVALLVTTGCGGFEEDAAEAEEAAQDAAYDIRQSQCDGIRAAGTITNRSGGDAAFEITAHFTYREGQSGLPLQTTVTEVLADGESTDFSISSDRSGAGTPSGCDILGAEIVGPAEEDDAAAAAPDSLDEGWVAVGGQGTILISEDGEAWFEVDSGTTESLSDVAYADGQWVAVGFEGVVLTSSDGVTWSSGESGVDVQLERVRYVDGQWQARPANGSDLLTSPDGSTWTLQEDAYPVDRNAPDHSEPFTVTDAGDARELALGRPGSFGGTVLLRVGGGTWEPVEVALERDSGSPIPAQRLSAVDFATDGEGTWVFVGGINERQFVVSDDLETWEARGDDAHSMAAVHHDEDDGWVAVGNRGRIFTSDDGRTWERLLPPATDVVLTGLAHTG